MSNEAIAKTYRHLASAAPAAVLATLAACSRGSYETSGAGSDRLPPPPPPPGDTGTIIVNPSMARDTGAGHWWGDLRKDGKAVNTVFCMLVDTGQLDCVVYDLNRVAKKAAMHGSFKVSASGEFSGSGRTYLFPGEVLADGTSTQADFTITAGQMSDQNRRLDLTISSLGEVSTLATGFDHYFYTVPAGILPGTYIDFDIFGDPASLSIDPSGTIFSQSAAGCISSGSISQDESGFNAYDVALAVSNCADLNGDYAGSGTFIDFTFNDSDRLLVAVFTDTSMIVGEAIK